MGMCAHARTASLGRAVPGRTRVHISMYLCTHGPVLCTCRHPYVCARYHLRTGTQGRYVHGGRHTRVVFIVSACPWVCLEVWGGTDCVYECVLAETQQREGLIAAGAGSRQPMIQSGSSQAPPGAS